MHLTGTLYKLDHMILPIPPIIIFNFPTQADLCIKQQININLLRRNSQSETVGKSLTLKPGLINHCLRNKNHIASWVQVRNMLM